MKTLLKYLLLLALVPTSALLPFNSFAGAQKFAYLSGYSFRDVIGSTYAGHYGWNSTQCTSAARAAYQGTATPSRFPNSTVAWQIQHGDDPLAEGSNKERCEVLGMFGGGSTDESAASGTQYYGLSTYLASGWVDPANGGNQWFIIAQIHGDDTNVGHSSQANVQFLLASPFNSAKHYTLRTVGGAIGVSGAISNANDVVTDLGAHVYNTWVDWVFKITWSSTSGHVTVYKRVVGTDATLKQVADYSAPTIYSASGVDQTTRYWKHGIYRGDDGTQGTATVYMGPFTRAASLQDAATAAFGQWP